MKSDEILMIFCLLGTAFLGYIISDLQHRRNIIDVNKQWQDKLIKLELAHYEFDAKTGVSTFVINAEKK